MIRPDSIRRQKIGRARGAHDIILIDPIAADSDGTNQLPVSIKWKAAGKIVIPFGNLGSGGMNGGNRAVGVGTRSGSCEPSKPEKISWKPLKGPGPLGSIPGG